MKNLPFKTVAFEALSLSLFRSLYRYNCQLDWPVDEGGRKGYIGGFIAFALLKDYEQNYRLKLH